MTRHKIIAFSSFLLLLFTTTPALAFICGSSGDTVVYYGNGVSASAGFDDETKARIKIDLALRDAMLPEDYDKLEFDNAFNYSDGLVLDLMEAALQDVQTDVSSFWRILGNYVPMPDALAERILGLSDQIDESALVTSDSLEEHLNDYKNSIAEGKKVVVVAHSQGNFFANQAYGNLDSRQKQSFGIVSVANPDSSVAGIGPYYTTLVSDLVIDGIIILKTRLGLPAPMLPNTVNSLTDINDFLSHNFKNTYMAAYSSSKQSIVDDLMVVIDEVVAPTAIVQSGVITITLTWGVQRDIDLHVYEPDGTHVYYGNRSGNSGYLDRDDVTSFGPEHYYVVSCEDLMAGNYQVGLDYYYGTAPETAKIQIDAGLSTRQFTRYMSSPSYGSPSSPAPVADINVIQMPDGGFDFQIAER